MNLRNVAGNGDRLGECCCQLRVGVQFVNGITGSPLSTLFEFSSSIRHPNLVSYSSNFMSLWVKGLLGFELGLNDFRWGLMVPRGAPTVAELAPKNHGFQLPLSRCYSCFSAILLRVENPRRLRLRT